MLDRPVRNSHRNKVLILLVAWCLSLSAAGQSPSVASIIAKGQRAFNAGQYTEALHLFEEARRASPGCTIGFFIGLAHYRLKRLDQAIIDFSSAAACNPSFADARLALGDALVEKGDDRRALAAYEAALKLRPDDTDALRTAASLYLRHELNTQAVPLLERLVRSKPADIEASIDLGAAYAATSQFQKAEKQLTDVRRMAPDNPAALVALGALDLKTGRTRDAIPSLLQAARIAPDQYKPHFLLGSAYSRLGEYQRAVKELELAAKKAPDDPEVLYQLAQAYDRFGLKEQQQAAMARFSALKKQSQEAYEARAKAPSLLLEAQPLIEAGKLQEAIELVRKALSLDPGNDHILFRLASVYYDAGQYDLAGQNAQQAIAQAPSEWTYHYLLGLIEEQTGQVAQASDSYETALGVNPRCAECYSHLGELAMRANNPERAIKNFERAVRLEPGKSEYKLNLQAAYRAAGQKP